MFCLVYMRQWSLITKIKMPKTYIGETIINNMKRKLNMKQKLIMIENKRITIINNNLNSKKQ